MDYSEIGNKVGLVVFRDFPFTTAQNADNYRTIFTPIFPCEVLSIIEKHDRAGSVDATLDVLKVTNGSTSASGQSMLRTQFDLTTTDTGTAVIKRGLQMNANRSLDPLDSIALKINGTLTNVEGVSITIYLKPLNMGQYRNY